MKNIFWHYLLFFSIPFVFGQDTSYFNNQVNLNQVKGFKQNSVKAIVEDNNGILWVATEMGLYKYDGQTLVEIKDKKYPNISKQRINHLAVDTKSKSVYFSTYPEGILYNIINNRVYKKGKEDQFNKAFFSTENKFYYLNNVKANKIVEFNKKNNFNFYNWNLNKVMLTSNKYTYFTQKNKVLVFDTKEKMVELQHPFSNSLRLLKFGKNIVLFDKGKAFLINGKKINSKPIEVSSELDAKYLKLNEDYYIHGQEDNYFYFHNGIVYSIQYKYSKLILVPKFYFDKKDLSTIFYNKKEKIYFLGTYSNGLYIAKPKHFNGLSVKDDTRNSCYSIAKGDNNRWFTTNGWSFSKSNSKIEFHSSFPKNNGRFLLNYKNALCFLGSNGFINIKTQKTLNSLYFKNNNSENYPATSYTYLKKQFWFSNLKNVFYLVKDSLVKDSFLETKLKKADIHQIINFNDNLLIATTKGVFKYTPFTNHITSIVGLQNKYARYIKIIDHNRFWVGCYGDGLFLVENNKAYRVTDKNNDIETTHAVEDDKKGNLWITTNDGLLVVNKKEILSKTLLNKAIECYRYSVEDGLATNEFNGGCTHPSFRDSDGSLGFPSIKGVVWFFPEKTQQNVFTGKIIIDQVSADGQIIEFTNNKFCIPKDAELLSINFSYPYYFNRENLSVEYRFKDSEQWTELKEDKITIARTQKGTRELLMRIRTHGDVQNKYSTQSFTFDFQARYYETIWFWGISMFLVVLLLVFAYQIGLKLSKRREELLEKKIEQKTFELQESVNELAISKEIVFKSLQEKEVLLKEVHHRVKNNLQLIISMLNIQARRKNYDSIEDFLQKAETRISSMALIHQNFYMNEESLKKINFQSYIEDLVNSINQTFDNTRDKVQILIDINHIILNLSTAIPLGLIINELITNSLKHAFPGNKKGSVSIKIVNIALNQFELIIEDNGVGIDKDKIQTKTFGLELINLLASQLKGSAKFENIGTTKYTISFQEIDL